MKTLTPDQRMEGFTELVDENENAHLASFLAGVAHAEKVLGEEPKVPFVRLTEEELKGCWGFPYSLSTDELRRFARAIEDALEEKNK